MLFFRCLWWFAASAASLVLFRRLARTFEPVSSALIASLLMLFVPLGITAPSYNTFGMLFITLALCSNSFLSFEQLTAMAFACWCYPTFCVLVPLYFGVALIKAKKRVPLLWMAGGFAGVGIAVVLICGILFGFENLRDSVLFSGRFGEFGTSEKFEFWYRQIAYFRDAVRPRLPYFYFLPVLVVGCFTRARWYFGMAFVALTLYAKHEHAPSHYWVVLIGTIGLVLSFHKGNWMPRRLVFIGACALVLTAWSSGGGLVNGVVGGFPIFVAALVALNHLSVGTARRAAFIILLTVLVCSFGIAGWEAFYRDGPLDSLVARIDSGAFRGLYTVQENVTKLEELEKALQVIDDDGKSSVIFLDEFPMGYLMSHLRPKTRMLFMMRMQFPPDILPMILPNGPDGFADYAVRTTIGEPPAEDVNLASTYSVANGYHEIKKGSFFVIFKREQ